MKAFWKVKKNIVFCESGACFFLWDSSGTAWHVNVLEQREKTLGAWISLCSYLELPKSHFISATNFFCFLILFFFYFFSNECNEFLKLRSDFSHNKNEIFKTGLIQFNSFSFEFSTTRFIVYKCALLLFFTPNTSNF